MTMVGVPDPAAMRSHWKWFLLVGIAFVVLGLIALGNLIATTLITTVIVGVLLVLAGAFQVFGAFAHDSSLGWRILGLVLGILYVLVGWDILANPLSGALTLTLAVAIFLFASGIVRVVTAFTAAGGGHRVLLFLTGAINVLLGFWIWTGIPISGLAIGLFVGIDLIMAGVTWIVLALATRKLPAAAAAAG
jgi:uncharacterized membrane protein HdeD (DUF308 family)